MSELKIVDTGTYVVLDWDDLTSEEKRNFDYLDIFEDQQSAKFFRYNNVIYDLGQFVLHQSDLFVNWEGVHVNTFFSGILIRYPKGDDDHVVVGRYYC